MLAPEHGRMGFRSRRPFAGPGTGIVLNDETIEVRTALWEKNKVVE